MSITIGASTSKELQRGERPRIVGEFHKLDHPSDPTLNRWIFVPKPDSGVTDEQCMEACKKWASTFRLNLDRNAWIKKRNPEQVRNSNEVEAVVQQLRDKCSSYEAAYTCLDTLIELAS